MTNTLSEPPQAIFLQDDCDLATDDDAEDARSFGLNLDLRQPRDAAAYLKAASHYLSCWPQEWSAERLCLALLTDGEDLGKEAFEDRQQIKPWEAVFFGQDPFFYVEELIMSLAEDFVEFSKYDFENQSGNSNSL